ncbi:ImmA/IrrE family metallo-endopeptidase [Clostridium perfringens]|uniref:ImmA/IrrE family metallo-endopeptidase n=1 Tax=Clostridium perfringens TaxID=1502 RepID=UPI0013E2A799|nr:ImmA/IrrE family metallo-endopeptidase [Clostridium perfringens]MDK0675262.1 ImmA/IrrE family metallo-endopeptidase [Clostridium perfringens]MDK0806290.1 ImmA/IrrE family metallo-endopeptidase [Clostridium perfringens]MDK0832345.1 ImmA/IrrE family metallo-endopeptidase [Clostridium perfringens]MDK0963368.1 ImmA/IrrE family metallo-endopeptidase [Clostridium perfringens]MDK0966315.1 ImmA/IrrE family metallo-endopeptidase [Clostridium perfringens]
MAFKKKSNEERKKEVDLLVEQANKKIDKVFNSPEDIKEYLSFMSKFYNYSFKNSILIEEQFRGARAVGSFAFWKEKGYVVNKGEKGIKILVPTKLGDRFEAEDGTIKLVSKATEREKALIKETKLEFIPGKTLFKQGYVFDVSQTNVPLEEIPKLFPNRWLEGRVENYKGFFNSLENLADKIGIKIIEPKSELGQVKGVSYTFTNEVALNPRNSEIQNIKTLIHELAHAKLHTSETFLNYTQAEKEFQAEMVAFSVSSYFNIDTEEYSLRYLKSWTKDRDFKDKERLLKEVKETTKEFIETIESSLLNIKEKEILIEDEAVKEFLGKDKIKINELSKTELEELIEKNNSYTWFKIDGNKERDFKDFTGKNHVMLLKKELEVEKTNNSFFYKKNESEVLSMEYEKDINLSEDKFISDENRELNEKGAFKEPYITVDFCEENFFKKGEVIDLKEANERFKEAELKVRELKREAEQREEYYPYAKTKLKLHYAPEKVIPLHFDIGDGYVNDLKEFINKELKSAQYEDLRNSIDNTLDNKEKAFKKEVEPFYDINKLKEIPIGDIADKLGIDTVKRGNKLWCNLRGEKTASCCINIDKNYFYDFGGQPEGGDGIKFVSKAEGISAKDSIYRLADMFGIEPENNIDNSFKPSFHISNSDYKEIGIEPNRAMLNVDINLERQSLAEVMELEKSCAKTMNELANDDKSTFLNILNFKSMPIVYNNAKTYYSCIERINEYVKEYNSPIEGFNSLEVLLYKDFTKNLEEKLNKQIDILYRAGINERIGFDLSEEKVNLKKDLDDLFSASLSNGVEVYYNSNPDELKVIKSIEEFRDYAIDILVPELSGFEVSEEEITKMEKEVKSWTYTDFLEFCEGNDIEIVPLKKEKTIEIEKPVKEVRIKNKPMEL